MNTYFSLKDIASRGKPYVDTGRLDQILNVPGVVRRVQPARYEFILGTSATGAPMILVTDEENWRLPPYLRGGRPLRADKFTCLSPIVCTREELQAALKGKGGNSYTVLERARALNHVLHDPTDADRFGLPRLRANDFRVLSFAFNLMYKEETEAVKKAMPKIKDVGLAEAEFHDGSAEGGWGSAVQRGWAVKEGTTKHWKEASNKLSNWIEQDPQASGVLRTEKYQEEPFDGTQILPKDQINLASYFDVSGRDAKPIILLVSNAEFALPVLNALGVDTTRWKGKDGEDVLSQLFGLSCNSIDSRERDRSPRRENGARRYDDRSRRERDWGHSSAGRSSAYGRSASLEPGVYVVDIKMVFATYHASFTDTAGVRRMAKSAGLVRDHLWFGAGREAGLLIDLWRLFVSGPSTGLPKKVRDAAWERQRAALLGGGMSTGASDERLAEAQAVANGDDSDDDLNAGPSVVINTPAAGGGDPYLNDYSDRGDSDDDDY